MSIGRFTTVVQINIAAAPRPGAPPTTVWEMTAELYTLPQNRPADAATERIYRSWYLLYYDSAVSPLCMYATALATRGSRSTWKPNCQKKKKNLSLYRMWYYRYLCSAQIKMKIAFFFECSTTLIFKLHAISFIRRTQPKKWNSITRVTVSRGWGRLIYFSLFSNFV